MTANVLFGDRLLEFNLLPSKTLHPSRHAQFGGVTQPVPDACQAAWHRQWSARILRQLGLQDRPVLDADRPELALALLPPPRLARVAHHVGAALCASRLRRVIAGADVRRLTTALGPEVMGFAQQAPGRRGVSLDWLAGLDVDGLADAVDQTGSAMLMAALQAGGPELSQRAALKMADPSPLQGRPAIEPTDRQEALALALDVLQQIEPTWHSSFPVMH
ncbi:SctK family type III secretion system sorting platform protein [Castellaniella sp.]|uniref:SctK family type III secretion system sorting platform protein n=1 Tax=Castellaniella sp. TaxID=1955812 RepID=UPI002AFE4F5E|nr:SctK family type III secretion system sorting platform protein [Castellaniella sp.]